MERIFAFVTVTLFAAAIGLLGYWQFIDLASPPMRVLSSETDKRVYQQGETMIITRMICLDVDDRPYTVSRSFVDHIVFQLANFATQASLPGCHTRSIGIEIPPTLPPGRYVYKVYATFQNPLKTVRFDFPDLPEIQVVAKGG